MTAFARLLGRQPSEAEAARLFQVKDALGIGNNDALWIVLLSLENYDAQFRRYPALLQSAVDETLGRLRQTMAQAAEAENRKARRVLAEAVTATALQVASRQQSLTGLMAAAWAVTGGALLSGLSVTAGAILATGRVPSWYAASQTDSPVILVLRLVLGAPVGWLVIGAGATVGALVLSRRFRTVDHTMTHGQRMSVLLLAASAVAAFLAMYGSAILS